MEDTQEGGWGYFTRGEIQSEKAFPRLHLSWIHAGSLGKNLPGTGPGNSKHTDHRMERKLAGTELNKLGGQLAEGLRDQAGPPRATLQAMVRNF